MNIIEWLRNWKQKIDRKQKQVKENNDNNSVGLSGLPSALSIAAKTVAFDLVQCRPVQSELVELDLGRYVQLKTIKHPNTPNYINDIAEQFNYEIVNKIIDLGNKNKILLNVDTIDELIYEIILMLDDIIYGEEIFIIGGNNVINALYQSKYYGDKFNKEKGPLSVYCLGTIKIEQLGTDPYEIMLFKDTKMNTNTFCIGSKSHYNTESDNFIIFVPYILSEYDESDDSYKSKYIISTIGKTPEKRYKTVQVAFNEK